MLISLFFDANSYSVWANFGIQEQEATAAEVTCARMLAAKDEKECHSCDIVHQYAHYAIRPPWPWDLICFGFPLICLFQMSSWYSGAFPTICPVQISLVLSLRIQAIAWPSCITRLRWIVLASLNSQPGDVDPLFATMLNGRIFHTSVKNDFYLKIFEAEATDTTQTRSRFGRILDCRVDGLSAGRRTLALAPFQVALDAFNTSATIGAENRLILFISDVFGVENQSP